VISSAPQNKIYAKINRMIISEFMGLSGPLKLNHSRDPDVNDSFCQASVR